jgi:Uma2 family endonuclease
MALARTQPVPEPCPPPAPCPLPAGPSAGWPLPVGRVELCGSLAFVHAPWAGGYSVADYKRIRQPGRVELADGVAVVFPAPDPAHRRIVQGVHLAVREACPAGLAAFVGPMDVPAGAASVFAPDVLVLPPPGRDDGEARPPALVVEVAGAAGPDLPARARGYRDGGVDWYWFLDPDAASVTVADLRGGGSRVFPAGGVCAVDRPFPVAFDVSAVLGLR